MGDIRVHYRTELYCCIRRQIPIKSRMYQSGKCKGGLLVTRSFGDFFAKKEELGATPNTLICDYNEIIEATLTDEMHSIILASDGVWDAVSLAKLNQISRPELLTPKAKDLCLHIAECACELAVESKYWQRLGSTADNTTAIVISFRA